MNSLVSIIVPCYNQAQYLPETLDSVLVQTYPYWECIIVNDGSPDDTEEIAKAYCKKDNRFKYVYKENGGLSSARNTGIKASSGEFILPLDSDDLIGEHYLEKAMLQFREFPNTKLVYCKAQFFGNKEGEWMLPDYDYTILLFGNIIFCSAIYKKRDFDKTSGYDEELIKGLEDWDFWLSLLNESDLVFKIPAVCFYYRIREKSMIRSLTPEILLELRRKIYENHKEKYKDYIPDLIWNNCQLKNQQEYILRLENENNRIQKSKAYRLGKFILRPLNFIRNTFNPKNASNYK